MKETAKAIKHFFNRGVNTLDKRTLRAYRSQAVRSSGPDSFIMTLPQAIAERRHGVKNVRKFMWKHVQKPALHADMAAGHVLNDVAAEMTPLKKLFLMKEKVPNGKGHYREVERASVMAPAVKAVDVAKPLAVGYTLEKGIKKLRGQEESDG